MFKPLFKSNSSYDKLIIAAEHNIYHIVDELWE